MGGRSTIATQPHSRWWIGGKLEVSVTVTYRRKDNNLIVSRIGSGDSIAEAIANADAQLAPGTWRRLVCSTVSRIYGDLKRKEKYPARPGDAAAYEGLMVEVPKPKVRKPRGIELTDE